MYKEDLLRTHFKDEHPDEVQIDIDSRTCKGDPEDGHDLALR